MNEPWGVPDTDFLRAYVIGFAAALLFAYALRILTRAGRPGHESHQADHRLSTEELAYLAGGPKRVVETAVAGLVSRGDLHPSPGGYVRAGRRVTAADPVARAVLADVDRFGRRSIRMLVDRVREKDAVGGIRDRLVRSGLIVSERVAATRAMIGLLPAVSVVTIGVVRWLSRLHFPLTLLLVVSGGIVYLLYRQPSATRTFLGDRLLGEARAREIGLEHAPDATLMVAFGGLAAYPDIVVRSALVPPVHRPNSEAPRGGEMAGGVGDDGVDSRTASARRLPRRTTRASSRNIPAP